MEDINKERKGIDVFLTSNIGGIKKENGEKIAESFSNENKFLDNLKKSLKDNKKFVLVCSNPENIEQNSKYLELDITALNMSGIFFDEYVLLDNRNKKNVNEIIKDSSLIILCGGDTYLQNQFFNEINLKKYIAKVNATIVGISAGAINAADTVYNSPESEKDSLKPEILVGLNLTKINVEPHFDINNSNNIKMNSILEQSYKRTIYGLLDGSYIKDNVLYGKGYQICNGKIQIINQNSEEYEIR